MKMKVFDGQNFRAESWLIAFIAEPAPSNSARTQPPKTKPFAQIFERRSCKSRCVADILNGPVPSRAGDSR